VAWLFLELAEHLVKEGQPGELGHEVVLGLPLDEGDDRAVDLERVIPDGQCAARDVAVRERPPVPLARVDDDRQALRDPVERELLRRSPLAQSTDWGREFVAEGSGSPFESLCEHFL
jgi:hypothetical protein